MRVRVHVAGLLFVALVASGCGAGKAPPAKDAPKHQPGPQAGAPVELHHVHGLGYTPDGAKLVVPAHHGLVAYQDGKWQPMPGPAHDYMGFVATDSGFYSSGHPAPGSKLPNPLGIVKGAYGADPVPLAFHGEIDFHVMGVGYKNHAIYVLNPEATRSLKSGIHYSLDGGRTFKQSRLIGVNQAVYHIAVHPTNPFIIALATEDGLMISDDYGDWFRRVGAAGRVTAAAFTPDGRHIYYGYRTLYVVPTSSLAGEELRTPTVAERDAIGYIAVKPGATNEIAFATFGRDIHVSQDGGATWKAIARQGKGVQQ